MRKISEYVVSRGEVLASIRAGMFRAFAVVFALVFGFASQVFAQAPESSIEMPELVSAENFTDMLTAFITYLGPVILIALGGLLAFRGARVGLRWIMGVFGK